jgi:serine/threonine protein phosphatase PrpC
MVRAGYIHVHQIPETSGNSSLTKNIGDAEGSGPDVVSISPSKGDSFLLCCDGVWDPLHVEEGFWLPTDYESHQEMVEMVVGEALARGSSDNCSALLVMPTDWGGVV